MFREYSNFINAGSQSIDFYGQAFNPQRKYPLVMQQQYYNQYMANNAYQNQFAFHNQPVFIAGPIYKNSPVFHGPQYLSQSLLQPVPIQQQQQQQSSKRSSQQQFKTYDGQRYQETYEESSNFQQQQTEQNIQKRNDILDKWQKEVEQEKQLVEKEKEHQQYLQDQIQKQQNSHRSSQRKSQMSEQQQDQRFKIQRPKQNDNQEEEENEKPEKEEQAKPQGSRYKKEGRSKRIIPVKNKAKENQKVQFQVNVRGQKKSKAFRNLKVRFICLRYTIHFFQHLKKLLLDKRKKVYEISTDLINDANLKGSEFILTFLDKELRDFWKKSDSIDWLENSQIAEAEQKNRMTKVKLIVDKIIDRLAQYASETALDLELLKFLSIITQNYEYPPQQYYFNFEILRLKFTSFTALRDMDPFTQRMIIATFFIIRIICFTILFQPWTLGLAGVNKSGVMKQNGLIVTSVLHEIVISEFRPKPPNENNQNHLSQENRLLPRQNGPLKFDPDPKDVNERRKLKNLKEPLIYPIYNADEMKILFQGQAEWVDKAKNKLDEVYVKLSRAVQSYHMKNRIRLGTGTRKLWV